MGILVAPTGEDSGDLAYPTRTFHDLLSGQQLEREPPRCGSENGRITLDGFPNNCFKSFYAYVFEFPQVAVPGAAQ